MKLDEAQRCLEYLGYETKSAATRVTQVRLFSRRRSAILMVVLGALVVLGVVFIVARSETHRAAEAVAEPSQIISEDASDPVSSIPPECLGFWLPIVRGLLATPGG